MHAIRFIILPLLLLLISAVADDLPTMSASELRKIDRVILKYARQSEALLDPKVRAVLVRMPDPLRRMLATNHYLRRRHLLQQRWAMSAKEVRAYRKTAEYEAMINDVDSVKAKFAKQHPGYRLTTATSVRTLESQLGSWNRVRSVRLAAIELRDTCRSILADSTLRDASDSVVYQRFLGLFSTCETELLTTVAVPGFSLHGRLRAFDFRIMRGRHTVAGTSTAAIASEWDQPGWTVLLKEAVELAGGRFSGPLQEPYEPWHYEYVP